MGIFKRKNPPQTERIWLFEYRLSEEFEILFSGDMIDVDDPEHNCHWSDQLEKTRDNVSSHKSGDTTKDPGCEWDNC